MMVLISTYIQLLMIKSQWPSQEEIQSIQLVAKIAQVIGLTDCLQQKQSQSRYINNLPLKKTRVRKCNQSDILPLERQLQSQRKRSRQNSKETHSFSQTKSLRKGGIVDIFVNCLKPEEDPLICAKTKNIILRSDLARVRKQALQRDQIKKIANNKNQRSKILNQISGEMIVDLQPKPPQTKQQYWFNEYKRLKAMKPHSCSHQKLSQSLDLSKFRLIPKNEGLLIKSHEISSQSRSQSVYGRRRRLINIQFNGNNKVQIVYPLTQSRAEL